MSEYHFGVGVGKVSSAEYERVESIARSHGADFVNPRLPDGYRFWFSCPSRGEPFDGRTARAVMDEVGAVKTLARMARRR